MTDALVLAAIAAALVPPALVSLGQAGLRRLWHSPVSRVIGALEGPLLSLRRAGEEGVLPTDRERLRLQVVAAAAGLAAGMVMLGPLQAVALSLGSAWLATRSLLWRRERYRARLDDGVAAAALAVADALSGGQSVRSALTTAGTGVVGPIGHELRRAGAELAAGATTGGVLERLRARCPSRRVELLVAAITLQRHSGGNLAGLLREIASAIDGQDRARDEARSTIAQARFTASTVLALPLLGLLLAELLSPGAAARFTSSGAGVSLVAAATGLQTAGALVVRRLSRIAR
jgi:tight adherence protein B